MFEEIVALYYDYIYKYCRSVLNGDKYAAEDVTQEVFLILYKKKNKLTLDKNIKYWLIKTADYEMRRYFRQNPVDISLEYLPEDIIGAAEDPALQDSVFDCLSDADKKLLNEYYSEQDSKKVADKNNISLNALYKRINRIKQKLSKDLGKSNGKQC